MQSVLSAPWFLRLTSGFLRQFFPVLKIGNWVVISRFEEVKEALLRPDDFTIAQINFGRMKDLDLDFFLGMDTSPVHDREKGIMESVARHEDLPWIQEMIAKESAGLISAVRAEGKIEIIGTISRVVPIAFIERYLGIPVEDRGRMQKWMRTLFHHLFLNLTNDEKVHDEAKVVASELKEYMETVIAKFNTNKNPPPNSLLARLLELRDRHDFIDSDFIRRNLCGLMIGAVDTTSKCVVLILEELFGRPEKLKEAVRLAEQNKIEDLRKYCYEALRFNPHNPIIVRYTPRPVRIGRNGKYSVPANHKVAIGIFSAMHDSGAFENPKDFVVSRKNEYLHFGYGMHVCYGRYINAVQITEIVAALLRLKNLKPSRSRQAICDGPFPDVYWLEFDK
ncbi:hypothetical protein WSM22_25460 [Cytophagales bacterium WSM2-2]|nr:hypothetical protein WSM22_25460 [Cytophagales bacterium WSM2-2]